MHTARASPAQTINTWRFPNYSLAMADNVDSPKASVELQGQPATSEARQAEAANDGEKRMEEQVQKALEEALLATGLGNLLISEGQMENNPASEDKAEESERREEAGGDINLMIQGASCMPLEKEREGSPTVSALKREKCLPDSRVLLSPRTPLTDLPKVEWVDVTEQFMGAAHHLDHGELLQDDQFSLFDAMSAVELMDTKMDSALQWRTFSAYPRTLSEAIKMGILKCNGHSCDELLGIMDEVLACVATWLNGHTLAQTVFTSMYLLDLPRIENVYLRAFGQAVIKTVDYMRSCICQGRVYAEDDQQSVCFGFDMLNHVSETAVLAGLKEAEEKLQNVLKHPPNSQISASPAAQIDERNVEVWKALLVRLKFVRNLYLFVVAMGKYTAQGIETAVQKLSLSGSLINDILSSLHLGAQLDPTHPLTLGFHPVINQHLLPPSYKPYAILPRSEALRLFQTIVVQLQTVFGFGKLDTFRDIYRAIKDFCLTRDSPNVLVRSLLVLICLHGDRRKLFGTQSLDVLLKEDAKHLTLPPSLNARSPLSTSVQGKEAVERFFGRSVAPMLEFLRVFCQHRARQRQRIVRCLEMMGDFQQESQRIDEILNALSLKLDPQRQHLACFSTWILYYILELMIEYVYLGFEYDLYSPFELHYVYWYLEFLYGWHQTAVKSAERLLLSEPQASGKGKRKAAKKNKRELPKDKEREMAVMHAKRLTCLGVMRGLEALILDNKIPQPSFNFGSEQFCFHHRFLPFTYLLTPQFLPYSDYVKLASVKNYEGKDLNLYDASAKHFLSARTAVENITHRDEELEDLLKVIKTNVVIMNLTAKGHKRDSKIPPSFDYSVHKHFPVVRVQ